MHSDQLLRKIDMNDGSVWDDRVARLTWGAYISAIEAKAIMTAHHLLATPATALDVGCGGGRWSKLLSDLGWNMICTEVEPELLRICKTKVPTATCLLSQPADTTIPRTSGSIQLLLCMGVAKVVKTNWFIDESFRLLDLGGLMVGMFFNLLSYRGLLAHSTSSFRHSYDYYELTYPGWKRRVTQKGFVFLHQQGLCWFPFRRMSNSRLVPFCSRIEKYSGLSKLPGISPWVVFVAQKQRL